jgi:uncharacterized protein DUF5994
MTERPFPRTPSTSPSPGTGPGLPVKGLALRVRMDPTRAGRGPLSGAWWPHSHNLTAELPALVTGLDSWLGAGPGPRRHVDRVSVSLTIWDSVPAHFDVAGRRVHLSWFGTADTNTLSASCSDHSRVDLLVIPPDTPPAPAEAALAMASDPDNTRRGTAVLATTAR